MNRRVLVVADTSPICYLILIGRVELLFAVFGAVTLPQQVHRGLLRGESPEEVRLWAVSLPRWVTVRTVEVAESLDLDPGETEAIYLAKLLGAMLIVDDSKARVVAATQGLKITGLIGVLALAAEQSLIDFADAIADLKQTTFRIHPSVVAPSVVAPLMTRFRNSP